MLTRATTTSNPQRKIILGLNLAFEIHRPVQKPVGSVQIACSQNPTLKNDSRIKVQKYQNENKLLSIQLV
jgi:hypothetical protein